MIAYCSTHKFITIFLRFKELHIYFPCDSMEYLVQKRYKVSEYVEISFYIASGRALTIKKTQKLKSNFN